MRKPLLLLAAALIAILAVRWVADSLASDETRIQRRLDRMAAAFDESRLGPIADGLARDFADRHSGYDRALVLDALRLLFIEHATGPFPYRVSLEDVEIAVDGEVAGDSEADVALIARFQDVSGESPRTVWAVAVEARMIDRDGWQLHRSEHISAEGDWRGLR